MQDLTPKLRVFNRLASSQTAAETTTYAYNALGERIKKINQNGLSTVFHYGPNGELLYEQDANGNTKAYVWLNGRPLARIDNDAQIYYYHVDHLGTPQAMTDAAGTTVWKADYEPFGKATVKVGKVENNLRLPGQYYDRETGLHYNYFRDYDPGTGRYVEADPIGLEGGLNLYAYVDGNPIVLTDALGLEPANGSGFSTHYGNWCGRHWSGGKPGSNIPLKPDGPTDSLDSCCMAHDYCFAKLEDSACDLPKNEKKKAFKGCNAILARCSRALSNNGVGWPLPPRSTGDAYFYKQKLQAVFK